MYVLTITFRDGSQRIGITDWPDAEEHLRNAAAEAVKVETSAGRFVSGFTKQQLEEQTA